MKRRSTSFAKENNGRFLSTENCLWLVIVVFLLIRPESLSWTTLLTVLQYTIELAFKVSQLKNETSQSSSWQRGSDEGGPMQVALLSCLFQTLKISDHRNLAKYVTLVSSTHKGFVCVSFLMAVWLDHSLRSVQSTIFAVIWCCLDALSNRNRGSLTRGESSVLVTLSTILFSEVAMAIHCSDSCLDISHTLVSLLGGAGCLVTCIALVFFRFPWWIRLQCHLLGPLAVVESGLVWHGYSSQFSDYLPRCLDWLVEFLLSTERGYPRYFCVFYWLVVLTMCFVPTSLVLDTSDDVLSVVVRRKWFHAVAVILFSPATFVFPELISLSYAIALYVLAVLEDLRRDIPTLQAFYLSFIDRTKDNPELIVSHMFLILGCALPLWISEYVGETGAAILLLSQWGILCLGIGDAAGAVIGSWYGKHQWGKNRRTLEGSLAMWASMNIIGIAVVPNDCRIPLFSASTVTTVMEAFTMQMDNLVLPIIGSTVILLLQT